MLENRVQLISEKKKLATPRPFEHSDSTYFRFHLTLDIYFYFISKLVFNISYCFILEQHFSFLFWFLVFFIKRDSVNRSAPEYRLSCQFFSFFLGIVPENRLSCLFLYFLGIVPLRLTAPETLQ